jgi:hypothetical protein
MTTDDPRVAPSPAAAPAPSKGSVEQLEAIVSRFVDVAHANLVKQQSDLDNLREFVTANAADVMAFNRAQPDTASRIKEHLAERERLRQPVFSFGGGG